MSTFESAIPPREIHGRLSFYCGSNGDVFLGCRNAEIPMDIDMLVKEVAEKIGIADPLHYSRVIRSVHGVSPLQLRETLSD